MESISIPYKITNQFSKLMLDYLDRSSVLKEFITAFPSEEALIQQSKNRKFDKATRKTLVKSVERQYSDAGLNVPQSLQDLLKEKTFTITTGHQLNLFTGPLYSIIKIACVIRLAEQLNQKDISVVPVFWMATEDHDLDEIDHCFVNQQVIKWETDQTGAVGEMSPASIAQTFKVLKQVLGADFDSDMLKAIMDCYDSTSLSIAHRRLVNLLFKDHPLVIVDGNDPALKACFRDIMKQELLQSVSDPLVRKQSEKLEKNYKSQAFSRPINLFYLGKNYRERLERMSDGFKLANDVKSWKSDELMDELETNPERFSPNVLLRPLYQETILPNLAYVGGGGEIAYWFQLKSMFEEFKTDFPILIMRNSVGLARKKDLEWWAKLGFETVHLFENTDVLLKQMARSKSDHFDLEMESEEIIKLFNEIQTRVKSIDKTLVASAEAEQTRILKRLKVLEKKITRAVKRNHSEDVNRVISIKDSILPGNSLSERKNNLFQYYEPSLIRNLIKHSDPINNNNFQILTI